MFEIREYRVFPTKLKCILDHGSKRPGLFSTYSAYHSSCGLSRHPRFLDPISNHAIPRAPRNFFTI